MNPPATIRLTDRAGRDIAVERLEKHLPLSVAGYECTTEMVRDVLLKAAVMRQTVEAVCQDLAVSTSNTIRAYLHEQIRADDLAALERCVNATLVAGVPAQMWAKAWNVAFDFHAEPFYGQSPALWAYACGGAAPAGTPRFSRVATAYVMAKNVRITLALLFVRPEDSIPEVLACVMRRLQILELPVRRLRLDKGFCTILVLRDVAASGGSAILACPIPGKQGGTQALCHGSTSYRSQDTFRSQEYGEFTAEVVVVRSLTTPQRTHQAKRRLRWLGYGVFQCDARAFRQMRRLYRRRFGIEASYRGMRQVRAWTPSRNPA